MTKGVLAVLGALMLAIAAIPAQAQDDHALATRFQPPAPAASPLGLAASDTARASDLVLRHRLKVDFSGNSASDSSADEPRFGLELGYGAAAPPQRSAASRSNLPKEFWGRPGQESIKAVLGVPF
jgi:hypothetical protein